MHATKLQTSGASRLHIPDLYVTTTHALASPSALSLSQYRESRPTTARSPADMVGTDKVKGSPSRSCSWSTRPTPRRSASASPAATGYHPARVPLRTTASTWTRSTRMAPGSMNYIKIRLVLVLVLDTILPHRLLRPSSSPASYVFYSYSLVMSTGISAL